MIGRFVRREFTVLDNDARLLPTGLYAGECERFHEPSCTPPAPRRRPKSEGGGIRQVVAFAVSFLATILLMAGILLYGQHRPVGAPLSWGEALAAATFVFFLMFLAYGVVPHQWLLWANIELRYTPSKKIFTVGQWEIFGAGMPPFTMDAEKLRDLIVVAIYGFYLTCHVALWAIWQDRAKRAEKKAQRELAPSSYGRPLVKQGG